MLGEQFMVGDEICGAVVSIRPNVSDMNVNALDLTSLHILIQCTHHTGGYIVTVE